MSWSGAVYQCLNCHKAYLPEFGPIRCPFCQSKERDQTGKIDDPAAFIMRLLNAPTVEVSAELSSLGGPERCQVCHELASVGFYNGEPCVWHSFCSKCFKQYNDEAAACVPMSKS